MNWVLIECPFTGELVATGFEAVDLDELEPANTLIDCPACGNDHAWTPKDALLTTYTLQAATGRGIGAR